MYLKKYLIMKTLVYFLLIHFEICINLFNKKWINLYKIWKYIYIFFLIKTKGLRIQAVLSQQQYKQRRHKCGNITNIPFIMYL